MSFPPIIIDNSSHDVLPESPVYIYGHSGRCWKFKNKEDATKYFDELTKKDTCPELLTDIHYLVGRYGESILKRLAFIVPHPFYGGESPILIESHYDVEISHKGKREYSGPAQKYTYFYKKANICITCDKKYSLFSEEPLQYLFPDGHCKRHNSLNYLCGGHMNPDIELLHDYILGDRVRYTEPQLPIPTTPISQGCFPFWNLFRTAPSYERINVNLHLE